MVILLFQFILILFILKLLLFILLLLLWLFYLKTTALTISIIVISFTISFTAASNLIWILVSFIRIFKQNLLLYTNMSLRIFVSNNKFSLKFLIYIIYKYY